MGRPIEWIKVLVEREYGVPFEKQDILIGDKSVPNVLTLSDIPEVSSSKENVIVVKVIILF